MTDYEMTKKFDKDTLLHYIMEMGDALMVFYRDGKILQEHQVIRENYVWDFVKQAVELDEVKEKLIENES
jgi:hypothetical protein